MNTKSGEYGILIGSNIIFGGVTSLFLGGMSNIPLKPVSYITIVSFVLWGFYSAILCEMTMSFICELKGVKYVLFSCLFGVIVACIKMLSDYMITLILPPAKSLMRVAIRDEIYTVLFILLLTTVLFIFIAKSKINLKEKKATKFVCWLVAIIVLYCIFILNLVIQNRLAIEKFSAAEDEIHNLDIHFAYKILDGNVWFCIIFAIIYWICVRKMTQKVNEEDKRKG